MEQNERIRDVMLIVDDVDINRAILGQMFINEYEIVEAENGLVAVEYLEKNSERVAMVFLDIKMPVMDGFSVMEYMSNRNLMGVIPVILITSDEDGNAMERGYELGATDVIFKPFKASIVIQRAHNVLEVFRHRYHLEGLVAQKTMELVTQYEHLKLHHEHLIEVLHDVIEYRNAESVLHIRYVQEYTRILATHYAKLYPRAKMTADKIDKIVRAAQLHDVGKIAMPDDVLTRPGRLSKSELSMLKEHTIKGASLIRVMTEFEDEEYSRICYNVCMYHHEKYDGSGYPGLIRRDRIPIEAQLVGLADMYDAMVHSNYITYTPNQVYEMLIQGKCGELSPKIRQCFESARAELEHLKL